MQLFAFDETKEDPANPQGDQSSRMSGNRDSGVSLTKNVWYRFLIRVDDVDGKTKISAKVWENGTDEPESFQIQAEDAAQERLTTGRIGMWSAVRGEAYLDEIVARSPVDHTAPDVRFFRLDENGAEVELAPGYATNQAVTVIVRAMDDSDPDLSVVATLNGVPFESPATVSVEGEHKVEAVATDSAGHEYRGDVTFYIDTTPPVVTVLDGAASFPDPAIFNRDVSINLAIDDELGTAVVAAIDGVPFIPGTILAPAPPYGIEAASHTLTGTVTDDAGNVTTFEKTFVLDKTKPVIRVTRDGATFSGGAFNTDVAVVIDVQDLTPTETVITLNGQPYTSGAPITEDGTYSLSIATRDIAGNEQTAGPIAFTINKSGPGVELLDGEQVLVADGYYPRTVPLRIRVTNILPPTVSATLDGTDWPLTLVSTAGDIHLYEGPPVAAEGPHAIVARVTDAAGNDVRPERSFTIDLTRPTLAVLESGVELTESILLARPAVIGATASDEVALRDISIEVGDVQLTAAPDLSGTAAITAPPTTQDGCTSSVRRRLTARRIRLTPDRI
jgi:hypothetical protein